MGFFKVYWIFNKFVQVSVKYLFSFILHRIIVNEYFGVVTLMKILIKLVKLNDNEQNF